MSCGKDGCAYDEDNVCAMCGEGEDGQDPLEPNYWEEPDYE